MSSSVHREGEIYKVYTIDDHTFEIRYGYYEDKDRGRVEPLPIYPDLSKYEHCTRDGYPIVTIVQTPCGHYKPRVAHAPEQWCGDCRHYSGGRDEVGICSCIRHRRNIMRENA